MARSNTTTTGQPKTTPDAKVAAKVEKIREELAQVQFFARTGRLPLESPWDEPIAPGLPPKRHPGVVLLFQDGVCTLDPKRDAKVIEKVRAWIAEGVDPRIDQLGVLEIAKDAVAPPFPKWDAVNEGRCIEAVEEMGFDVERCLRYEIANLNRAKLVKALEAKLVEEPEVDDAADPVLD